MKAESKDYLHELLDFFSAKLGSREFVFLTDRPIDIKDRYIGKDFNVHIACTRWQLLTKRRMFLTIAEQNIKLVSLHHMQADFLDNKIFICTDFLETKPLIALFHSGVRRTLRLARLSVTSTSKNRLWGFRSIKLLMRPNKTPLVGTLPGSDRDLITIGGWDTDVLASSYELNSVLAVIAQFNEIDIILPTIEHLLDQGVDVHVIDNWSNDGSFEIVEKASSDNPGRVTYERFPKRPNAKWEYGKTIERITQVAKEKPDYDWIMLNDADEIRWSPWQGVSLQKAFSFIDSVGYNCVDYTVFNLVPTEDGFEQGMDPLKFFRYGEFGREPWYFIQLKTWKNHPEAEMVSTGGHIINFPGRKVFPIKFLLAHYSFRSNAQANKKIFKERQPRLLASETKKGWNVHYKQPKKQQSFIRSKDGLVGFTRQDFWSRYLLERLSGIGIKRM